MKDNMILIWCKSFSVASRFFPVALCRILPFSGADCGFLLPSSELLITDPATRSVESSQLLFCSVNARYGRIKLKTHRGIIEILS
ncbi:hypothetical protein RB195_018876 [Necator americanus]|uniref:Secreted protein n=1 Tax=Necator americanus TaxID=51031 RepID=A0ABR1CF92_NECAM